MTVHVRNAHYRTSEGSDSGRPLSVRVEFQGQDLRALGIDHLRLQARETSTIEEIDRLSADMRRLLDGSVIFQDP